MVEQGATREPGHFGSSLSYSYSLPWPFLQIRESQRQAREGQVLGNPNSKKSEDLFYVGY